MTSTPPDNHRLMAAVDATWPAAEYRRLGPWLLRRGDGGGQRVSAASTEEEAPDPAPAAEAMRAWGQLPLFRVTPAQASLDRHLAGAGYARKDPVAVYCGATAALADNADETVRVFRVAAPLAILTEIWEAGGIGPGRRAVMERPAGPHVTLMSRAEDRPAGAAFVAIDDDIAMIHAIEVAPEQRRKGGGEMLLRGAASFAIEHGASWLALAVTDANAPARRLYEKLGMTVAGGYHYRVLPE